MAEVNYAFDALQNFLQAQDFSVLEREPVGLLKTPKFDGYLCCWGCIWFTVTFGFSPCFIPIGTCCPCKLAPMHDMQLRKDGVEAVRAWNDCCCHIATEKKTVPYDRIADVEIEQTCIHTCCGVKQVNIQTTSGGQEVEVAAAYLLHPEETRDALRLAMRLRKPTAVPQTQTAARNELGRRLAELNDLVNNAVLTQVEADDIKVPVMAASDNPLSCLFEALELVNQGVMDQAELQQLKAKVVARLV